MLKTTCFAIIALATAAGAAFAEPSPYGTATSHDDYYSSGFELSGGTRAPSHYQADPNGSRSDNHGASGNVDRHNGAYGGGQ